MDLLAILLVPLMIGVAFSLGSTRRLVRRIGPQQRDGIVASEPSITTAPEKEESIPIRHLRHACGCNTAGCEL